MQCLDAVVSNVLPTGQHTFLLQQIQNALQADQLFVKLHLSQCQEKRSDNVMMFRTTVNVVTNTRTNDMYYISKILTIEVVHIIRCIEGPQECSFKTQGPQECSFKT